MRATLDTPPTDVELSAFVALKAYSEPARRILGASILLLAASDAAGVIRELVGAGLVVARR
jgi:hypothetical protein